MLDTIADRIKLLGFKIVLLSGYELSSFKKTSNKCIEYQITINPANEEYIHKVTINNNLIFYSRSFTEKDFNTDFLSVIYHLKTHLNTHQRNTDEGTNKQHFFGDQYNSD